MRSAEAIHLFFFSLLLLLAWLRPLDPRSRRTATAIGTLGLGLTVLSLKSILVLDPEQATPLRDWLPAAQMLLVYHLAGCFFEKPDLRVQSWLACWDRKVLGSMLAWISRPGPNRWLGRICELAYMSAYPMIPAALAALYVVGQAHDSDTYWSFVLPPTYACYSLLPWIQTLPPRTVESPSVLEGRASVIRRINLCVLRHGSIGVNTFPSAHVASTVSAACALLALSHPGLGLSALATAMLVGLGAFLGRYHYAVDVVLGVMLAGAWCLLVAG